MHPVSGRTVLVQGRLFYLRNVLALLTSITTIPSSHLAPTAVPTSTLATTTTAVATVTPDETTVATKSSDAAATLAAFAAATTVVAEPKAAELARICAPRPN